MKECQNIEWKETWSDEYLKWICGFANAQGGKLYIGGDDSEKVVGGMNQAGLPRPKIEDDNGGVKITMYRKIGGPQDVAQDVAQGVAQGVAQEITDLQKKILKIIRKNPHVSRSDIANQCGNSVKTIERSLAKMTNLIKYVGRGYSGHWEIITPTDQERHSR